MLTTRFAPSPTGRLHLGHAYAAWFAADLAAANAGRFLVRLEDIDQQRCRPAFAAAIDEDLAWLGIPGDEPVRRQSDHYADYATALARLTSMGLIYRCYLTRRRLNAIFAAPHGTPAAGEVVFDTDAALPADERDRLAAAGAPYALRLSCRAALARTGPLTWHDRVAGSQNVRAEMIGDVVLARKDSPTSYHLAVTVDDAAQGVTLVTRGRDLFAASHVHRLLQALLDLPVPEYHHHRLITDSAGRRFAKRDQAVTLAALRAEGHSPQDLREMVGL